MRHDWFSPEQFKILEDCGFEKEYNKYSDGIDDYNKWRVIHKYEDGSQIEAVNETNKSGTIEHYSLEWSPADENGVPLLYNGSKKVFNSFKDLIRFIKE